VSLPDELIRFESDAAARSQLPLVLVDGRLERERFHSSRMKHPPGRISTIHRMPQNRDEPRRWQRAVNALRDIRNREIARRGLAERSFGRHIRKVFPEIRGQALLVRRIEKMRLLRP
jgi:hypothetical protein